MSGKIEISSEDMDVILNGTLIQGISVFRRVTGQDLRTSKSAVEMFQSKARDYREFFEPSDKCPHCNGRGFVAPKKTDGDSTQEGKAASD